MPCENGGECRLQSDGSNICVCVNGYFGNYCERKEQTCSLDCHHGHCLIENGHEYCECNHGWGGLLCTKVNLFHQSAQTNFDQEKTKTTCSLKCNKGVCIGNDQDGSAECKCNAGWEGQGVQVFIF